MPSGRRRLTDRRASVTGASLRVFDENGRRYLHLGPLCQSEAIIRPDGSVSLAQPWELIQVLLLLCASWLPRLAAAATSAPRVLVLGVGGANLLRVLAELLPAEASLLGVELEPEVLSVAVDFFGLRIDGRTAAVVGEAGDFLARAVAAMRQTVRPATDAPATTVAAETQQRAGEIWRVPVQRTSDEAAPTAMTEEWAAAATKATASTARVADAAEVALKPSSVRYQLIIIDCFTADGLATSVADGGALRDAAACLAWDGLCLVDLHTALGQGVLRDHDYTTAVRALERLCSLFDWVYKVECETCQNVIAVCHNGEMIDVDQWEEMLQRELSREATAALCPGFSLGGCVERFDFVGGRGDTS